MFIHRHHNQGDTINVV